MHDKIARSRILFLYFQSCKFQSPPAVPTDHFRPVLTGGHLTEDLDLLLDHGRYRTGADGAAAFTDSEAHLLFESDGSDELDGDFDVVARHDHLNALGELNVARNVGRTDVELRTIALHERGVTAALVLREDVNLALELRVRSDGTGLGENLTAGNFFLLRTTEEAADVVTGLTLLEELAEHFNARASGLGGRLETDDFNIVTNLDHAALDTTGNDRTTTFDREDVFDRHKEGLVEFTLRLGDVGVESVHELGDAIAGGVVLGSGLGGGISGAADNGSVVAIVVVLGKEVADFHLDELEHFGVVNEVALVKEDGNLRNADLTGEKNVLAGLGHGAVNGGNDEDSAIHLSSAGDHVLDVVGVAGAVNVSIVAVLGGVLDVRRSDRQNLGSVTTAGGLGSLGDLVVLDFVAEALEGLDVGDSGRKSGFTVVDVADRADVHVRLAAALECFLSHFSDSCELFIFLLHRPEWSHLTESNRRPHPYQGCALPTELKWPLLRRKLN